MCKLMLVVGAKKNSKLREFCKFAAPIISKHNNTDGFGYIAVKSDGEVFTEKWLKNDDAFNGNPLTSEDRDTISVMKDFIEAPDAEIYKSQGNKNWANTCSVLMHARYKTNGGININNTHPFNEDNAYLVHNGMVRNFEQFGITADNCDSTAFLKQYLANKVADNPSNIRDALEPMQGYWAVGMVAKLKDKTIVDIFTSKTASDSRTNTTYGKADIGGSGTLAMTFVNQLDGYVLATKQSDIEDVLKKMEWKHSNKFFAVQEKRMMRFDAVNGTPLDLIDHSGLTITNIKGGSTSGKSQTSTSTKEKPAHGSSSSAGPTTSNNASQSRGSLPESSTSENSKGRPESGLSVVNGGLLVDDLSATARFFYESKNGYYTEIPTSYLQGDNKSSEEKEVPAIEFDDVEIVASDSKYGQVTQGSLLLSDSRYPTSRDEITDEMQDLLDDYLFTLKEWEQIEIDGLPDDLKYKALLDHYNDSNVG